MSLKETNFSFLKEFELETLRKARLQCWLLYSVERSCAFLQHPYTFFIFNNVYQEARNKDVRRFGEMFTRKTSRIDTNTDLIHGLLISSDPFLASLRNVPKRSRSPMEHDVLELLALLIAND